METSAVERPIIFIDVAAQQASIRTRIDAAIARVLDHGHYVMGPEVARLEQKLADFSGAQHVVSCSSGTDALVLALMAKDFRAGEACKRKSVGERRSTS